MPRKLDPFTKANKRIAEVVAGHSPGRPTISRRTGRRIARATGVDEETCVEAFHVALAVGGFLAVRSWLRRGHVS
jgi:hypothetical protein